MGMELIWYKLLTVNQKRVVLYVKNVKESIN